MISLPESTNYQGDMLKLKEINNNNLMLPLLRLYYNYIDNPEDIFRKTYIIA